MVVDVFCYNGEPIVEQRLRYLAPVVDRFLVVEARHTHSGLEKADLYINTLKHVFEPYWNKVEFVVIDQFPTEADGDWWREQYQRDYVTGRLRELHTPSRPLLALVCDSDEIPSREAIASLVGEYATVSARPAVHLLMDFHYYGWEWTKPEMWAQAFAIAGNRLGPSLSMLRTSQPAALLPGAGWHCSYFMSPVDVARKIKSFAHREFDTPAVLDPCNIASALADGTDVLGRADEPPLQRTSPAALAAVPAELYKNMNASSSNAGGA